MRRGAIDDAAAELKSWLGARGHEPSEQPYNTLLKLALDDGLPSSAASSIIQMMEDEGLRPGVFEKFLSRHTPIIPGPKAAVVFRG